MFPSHDPATVSDAYFKTPHIGPIGNTISVSDDMTSMVVSDLVGYKVVFAGNTTNGDDQVITSYTADSPTTASYTTQTYSTTDWS